MASQRVSSNQGSEERSRAKDYYDGIFTHANSKFFTCNFTCNDSVLAVFTRTKRAFSAF